MKRFTPLYGILIVLLFVGAAVSASYLGRSGHERISPEDGMVRIDVASLAVQEVRFYRFLNYGNQEVKFFVGRDSDGAVQVAFDASETDYKRKRGFRHEGEWMVNNKCDTASRLAEVNDGGSGCNPVPLKHRLDGSTLILSETDILAGWRYFR
ncbi:MAG: Fe-S-containing protein [Acidobacteriota bacterium]